MTSGIVSALGRNQLGINTFENFAHRPTQPSILAIQVARCGHQWSVVGHQHRHLFALGRQHGIGFAIPFATARQVMDAIIARRLRHARLDRCRADRTTDGWYRPLASAWRGRAGHGCGAKVWRPKAGMQPGDVIVQVVVKTPAVSAALMTVVAALPPGAKLSLWSSAKPARATGHHARQAPDPAWFTPITTQSITAHSAWCLKQSVRGTRWLRGLIGGAFETRANQPDAKMPTL